MSLLGKKKLNIGKPPEKPTNTDLIQRITGAVGKYQLWVCFLMFLSKFPVSFNQMAIIFMAPKVKFICPSTNAETCPCPDPQYNRSIFTNTMIMKWHLICQKKWLASFTQTLFQLGTLVGSLTFGMLSDRFGRKAPLLVAVVMQISAGFSGIYMPNYWAFTFFRFLVGTATGGTMVITFVIVMEFVGTKYRDVISAIYQVPFNLGHLGLPILGYFFRDFRHFQLGITIPAMAQLSYFFFVSESPRWLIAMKRTEEAIVSLERIAKINNRRTDNVREIVEEYQLACERSNLKKGTILDLFRTPNIRKNIIAMSYNWLCCSYCFYGVSQYVGQLSGNVFTNVLAGATVTLCGTLLSIPLLKIIGRRTIVIIFNFICAGCLITLAVLPEGSGSVVCASIGQVSSFIVFVVVYLYCSELFPTVVRNAAIGFSSMMARVGSMIAPFIIGLRDKSLWLPPLLFAIVPLIGGFVTFLLPETKGCELVTTIEEGEQFGKKVKSTEGKD